MTEPPRAVLFDLDETLYLERRFALSGFAAVARAVAPQAGVPRTRSLRGSQRRLRRGDRAVAFQQLCSGLGWPESRVDSLVDLYRSHAPNLRLPRRTRQTLDVLRAEWRLGIVTNGPVGIQAAKIDTLGLEPLVDTVVFASTLRPGWRQAVAGGVRDRRATPRRDPAALRLRRRRPALRHRRGPSCRHEDDPDPPGRRTADAWLADYEEADAVTTSLLDVPQLAAGLLGETEALCA